MASVFPFIATTYAPLPSACNPLLETADLSSRIAPPYDVLNQQSKDALLSRDPNNVVRIDLPHLPAKTLGPSPVYQAAADTFRAWLKDGTLLQSTAPVMFVYRQSMTASATTKTGSQHNRLGLACTIPILPFGPRAGGGILPHEETFAGPKEDRLALMRATQAQLSPIFGLVNDHDGALVATLQKIASSRSPDFSAAAGDGVLHEVWTVSDNEQFAAIQSAVANDDVFIADGHHRYTTAQNLLKSMETAATTPLAPNHPARRCLSVLVSMSDPGLAILPTHRVFSGMSGYTIEALAHAGSENFEIHFTNAPITDLEAQLNRVAADRTAQGRAPNVFGMYDYPSRRCAIATLTTDDPLASLHGYKSKLWRELDVAIVQYLLVEEILQPKLNEGLGVKWSYPHTIAEVLELGAEPAPGTNRSPATFPPAAQLAVILRPTPLSAVREISSLGELMPQKSTFFSPKLATGLFMHDLRER